MQDGSIYTLGRGLNSPHKTNHLIKLSINNIEYMVNECNMFCYRLRK